MTTPARTPPLCVDLLPRSCQGTPTIERPPGAPPPGTRSTGRVHPDLERDLSTLAALLDDPDALASLGTSAVLVVHRLHWSPEGLASVDAAARRQRRTPDGNWLYALLSNDDLHGLLRQTMVGTTAVPLDMVTEVTRSQSPDVVRSFYIAPTNMGHTHAPLAKIHARSPLAVLVPPTARSIKGDN